MTTGTTVGGGEPSPYPDDPAQSMNRIRNFESARIPHAPGPVHSIALIGTYVPRQCGIGTFTSDLVGGLKALANDGRVAVVAVNDRSDGYDYPPEVEFEFNQNELREYRIAADYLNANRIDAVCVQHEYGIYGGKDGSHILKLIGQLRMPVVTTLHTVLREPSTSQREIVVELAERSDSLIVMSEAAKRFLVESYGIDESRVAHAPHGIPDMPFVDSDSCKDQFGVEGKKVLLTLGLLSPNKGIETVIEVLPRIAARHADVVYIVVGATHPHVRRTSGEAYRLGLQHLAQELGVDDRVIFQDRYVDLTELCEFLGAADVYVTPYLNEEQIVSGALAYALGAGKAVVSTPYWYACEMLQEGRGRLVGFGDTGALADAIIELLDDDVGRLALCERAYRFSRASVWKEVARRYVEIIGEVRDERRRTPRTFRAMTTRSRVVSAPEIDLRHVVRLTDDTGILQHATYCVPNRQHGYCTDDNARALIVVNRARPHVTDVSQIDQLVVRYVAFLQHAFDPIDCVFRNFLGYDRRWTEQKGSADSHGRSIWALGCAAAETAGERPQSVATELLHKALPSLEGTEDLRAISFALLGLAAYLLHYGGDSAAKRTHHLLADRLFHAFRTRANSGDWPWPEDVVTYANARLPQALLESGSQLAREDMVAQGLRSLQWLAEVQTAEDRFSPVGNRGWFPRAGIKARFDQQPIEADAFIAACASAFQITRDRVWLDRALSGFRWFLGRNDGGQTLYDHGTGGCSDGLQLEGVSQNQGAESTLAWLSALTQVYALQAAGEVGWTRETVADRAVQV